MQIRLQKQEILPILEYNDQEFKIWMLLKVSLNINYRKGCAMQNQALKAALGAQYSDDSQIKGDNGFITILISTSLEDTQMLR